MRYPPLLLLATLLLVGTFVVGSPARAVDPGTNVTVNGTVNGIDGTPASDAVVLIGEDSTLTKLSPAELRDIAATNPQNLAVVAVGGNGRFEARLGSLRAEAAVAVSDAGVSDLVYIRGENRTLSLQLYERRPQTVHAHLGAVGADERRTELYVNLVNSGDTTIENLSVTVSSLPDGWSVADVTTNGTYHSDDRTLSWSSVPPDAELDTTVVLSVPEEAPVGTYTVELRAESATHSVDVASETVEVLPEDTPGPTTSPRPGDDEEPSTTEANQSTPQPIDSPTETNASPSTASGPGFGIVATVTALVFMFALFVRRRQ